ncbi:MAG: hypothetical protein CL790_00430 [Chloroflexi bacterium]|nr:hypothetical protein [Chloroflexota bacterium]
MRISFSKLELYEFCPFAYRLRYIERQKLPFSKSLVVGAIVHAVLRNFFEALQLKADVSYEDFKDMHEEYWSNAPTLDPHRFPEVWSTSIDLLTSFWSANQNNFGAPIMLEQRFRLRMDLEDAHTVEGVIDRVDETLSGVEVIDYKSGGTPQSFPRRQKSQLHTYALALERGFNQSVSRLTVYYLRDNQAISMEPNYEFAQELLGRYRMASASIASGSFAPKPGSWCAGCDFFATCSHRWTGATKTSNSL